MTVLLLAVAMFFVGALAYYAFGAAGTVPVIALAALIGQSIRRKTLAQRDRKRGDGRTDS